MKKIHGLLLGSGLLLSALAGAFFFSPKTNTYQEVKADAVDSFYIGGQALTAEAPVEGDSGEATLTLSDTEATITLDNFKYTGVGSEIATSKYASFGFTIYSTRNVKIIVKGENEINNTIDSAEGSSYGIYCYFHKGDGPVNNRADFVSYDEDNIHSLKACGSGAGVNYTAGLYAYFGKFHFMGPDLSFFGGDTAVTTSSGMACDGYPSLSFESGKIVAHGGSSAKSSFGIQTQGSTTITGNDTIVECIAGTSGDGYSNGFSSSNSNVVVSGGSTIFSGNTYGISLRSDTRLDVSGSADLTLYGGTYALSAGSPTLNGGLRNTMLGYTWDQDDNRVELDKHIGESTYLSTDIKRVFLGELEFSVSDSGEVEYTGSAIPVVDFKPTKPSSNYDVKYGLNDGVYDLDTCPICSDIGDEATVYYKVSAENYHAKDGTTFVTGSRSIKVVKAEGTIDTVAVAATDLTYNGQYQDLLSTLPTAKASGTIEYSINDGAYSISAPKATDAGAYNIKYRVKADASHTASDIYEANVTIAKVEGEITNVAVAASGLKYNELSHGLLSIRPSAALNGIIEYRINDAESFTTDEPTGIDAGTYKIDYRVKEDTNHIVSELYTLNVSIAKASNYYTNEPRILFDNIYTGEERKLVTEGSAYHGTIYYKVDDGEYSTSIPTMTDVGKYVVYYKVEPSSNYDGIDEKSLNTSIAPVNKTSLISLIKSAEAYRDSIIEEDPDTASTLQTQIDAAIVVRDTLNKNITEVQNARLSLLESIENAQASFVIGRIDKIPNPVVLTTECYEKMTSANEAYSALSLSIKSKVTNYSVLTGANVTFVKLSIDNIGEVAYNDESEAKINDARKYYNAVNGTEKSLITNYSVLQEAEQTYKKLKEDYTAANGVIAVIDEIGEYTYSDDFKSTVISARNAYSVLSDDQKGLVTNIAILDNAELFIYQIENAIKKINAIGTVKYPASGKDIALARDAYDILSDAQKPFVSNYEKLENDELFYNQIDKVYDLIEAIGEVKYPDSKQAIADAKSAYKALTDEQKLFVSNYNLLASADTSFNQIDNTFILINAIGEVKYPDSEKAISNARSAYNNLSESQRAFVGEDTYNILLTAEDTFEKLSTDHKVAASVTSLIGRIGAVEYTASCKNRIDAAREGYDALSNDAQRSYVSNYEDLTAAESSYARLKTNYDAANSVRDLINEIGDVNLSSDCKAKINIARNKYNELTDDQKALVNLAVYESLVNAETTYTSLNNNRSIWMLVGIIVGGAVGLLALLYVSSFFLFNKWALVDGEVIRIVKVGKKYGANKVIAMPFRVIYCENDILFKKKRDAINKQSSK